ncbi:MAG: hypothetical protein KIT84_21270 [Labilithrix sp.]|nr:hypothetical protein [Labilithrix sp.]MCW5813574.1 hypothetical protein [Labilithrix sp.]
MRKVRRIALFASIAGAAGAVALACGGDDDGSPFAGGGDGGDIDSGGPIGVGDGGATGPTSGVVIVHAAAFPAFRLCFEKYPELPPQPDSRVLPQSNVVGVEMGSVTRIGAITRAPGKVYVINQTRVAATPDDPTQDDCGEVLAKADIQEGKDYEVLGPLSEPIGVDETTALVVSGCGRQGWLTETGVEPSECGEGFDANAGSLKVLTFPLAATTQTAATTLPVELVNLSEALAGDVPLGEHVDVTFGDLDAAAGAPLTQKVAESPPLYDASASALLDLDFTDETVYGTHGFRVAYRPDDAGPADDAGLADAAPPFSLDQTLATVQAMSRPDANPTTYFLAPSNFALLLLGDPRIKKTLEDGGANEGFDARRALHFLAVPVREDVDGGTLGGIGRPPR